MEPVYEGINLEWNENHLSEGETTSSTSKDETTRAESARGRAALCIIRPSNDLIKSTMDDRTYSLTERSTRYKQVMGKKIGKYAKEMDVQLLWKHFDLTDSKTIL